LTSKGGAYDPYLTRLAALGECIVVAVDFVSTLEKPFPAGLDECVKAIKWVVAGGTPGVPKGKVTITGDSAGGSLAMGVTLRAKQEGWVSEIAGVYIICPFLDGVAKDERYPSLEEFDGYLLNEGSMIAVLTNICEPSAKEECFKNPQLFAMNATSDDLQGLPPIKTIVMECDMIRDIGIAFHYKLKKAGADASLEIISGGIHDQQLFSSHSPEVTSQSIHDLAAFAKYVSKKKE
jgi:acetyl esterase